MHILARVLWCSAILLYIEIVSGNYTNSTISKAKMISDDFRIFQKTGRRVSRRDGHRFISFETKNDNIEVSISDINK